MSGIVERLSNPVSMSIFTSKDDMISFLLTERSEAADTITSLRSQLEEAKENAAESITWRTDDLNAQLAEARSSALEEAAKVAERFETEYASERDKYVHGTPDHWMNNSGSYAAMDIAAAIRRLKEGA